MRTLFTAFFFFLFFTAGFCTSPQIVGTDTVTRNFKNFDSATISQNSQGGDFNYDNTSEKEGGGLWAIISYYLHRLLDRTGEAKWNNISLNDLLLYGLIVFAAVMIVLQFFKVPIAGLFQRESTATIRYKSETENVFETDFDVRVKQAVNEKNYRLAIRLLYLQSLRKLSEAGLIRWQKNKTNFEYYYELKDEKLRTQFYELTMAFEYSWYGHIEIDENIFDQRAESFTGFLSSIPN